MYSADVANNVPTFILINGIIIAVLGVIAVIFTFPFSQQEANEEEAKTDPRERTISITASKESDVKAEKSGQTEEFKEEENKNAEQSVDKAYEFIVPNENEEPEKKEEEAKENPSVPEKKEEEHHEEYEVTHHDHHDHHDHDEHDHDKTHRTEKLDSDKVEKTTHLIVKKEKQVSDMFHRTVSFQKPKMRESIFNTVTLRYCIMIYCLMCKSLFNSI